jgi:hypothetical protein
MKKLALFGLILPTFGVLVWGQDPATVTSSQQTTQEQSRSANSSTTTTTTTTTSSNSTASRPVVSETYTWKGYLLDAGCPEISAIPLLSDQDLSRASRSSRTTTTTTTSNNSDNAGTSSADRSTRTTTVSNTTTTTVATVNPMNCKVTSNSRSFALWQDGRLMRFDEASNAKVVQQLQSSGHAKKYLEGKTDKPYRVKIKGVAEGDRIRVDKIDL